MAPCWVVAFPLSCAVRKRTPFEKVEDRESLGAISGAGIALRDTPLKVAPRLLHFSNGRYGNQLSSTGCPWEALVPGSQGLQRDLRTGRHMFSIIALATIALLPGDTPHDITRDQVRAVIERTKQATVEIAARRSDGYSRTTSYGAGAIVSSKGVVLTCLHVVRDFPSISLTTFDGVVHAAELVFTDTDLDLAILKFSSGGRYAGIPMGPKDTILEGESAIFAGYPQRGRRLMVHAKIEGKTSLVRVPAVTAGTKMLRFEGNVDTGFSGGPVVSLQGRLLGVVAARSTKNPGHGYALPTRLVFDSLRGKSSPDHGVAIRGPFYADDADIASYLVTEKGLFTIPPPPGAVAGLETNHLR